MSRYYPGLSEALAKLEHTSMKEDLAHIDNLYGRDNLKFGDTPDDVKAEARRQIRQDFTKPCDYPNCVCMARCG